MNIVNKACFVVGLLSVIFNIYGNEKDYDKSNLKIKKNRLKTHNDTNSSYIQRPPFIWADLLLGIVAPGTTKGFKINIDFYNGIIGAFELVESEEISIICQSSQKWSQKNILIGRRFTNRYNYLYFLAGFGKINGVKNGKITNNGSGCDWTLCCTEYETIDFNSFCVPIEFGMVLAVKYIGIGINIHINISKDYPTGGVLFNIPIGYIN